MIRSKLDLALALTFIFINASIVAFALLPTSTIIVAEVIAAVVASMSVFLVVMHTIRPGGNLIFRKGYLLTGLNALYVLIGFLATTDYGSNVDTPVIFALLACIVASYAVDAIFEATALDNSSDL